MPYPGTFIQIKYQTQEKGKGYKKNSYPEVIRGKWAKPTSREIAGEKELQSKVAVKIFPWYL